MDHEVITFYGFKIDRQTPLGAILSTLAQGFPGVLYINRQFLKTSQIHYFYLGVAEI